SARSDPLGDLQRRGAALATAGAVDGVRHYPAGQTGRSDHRSRKPDRESEGLVRHGRDSVERSDGADRTRRRSKMDDQGRHSLRRKETVGRRGANRREGEGRAESATGGRRNDGRRETKMKTSTEPHEETRRKRERLRVSSCGSVDVFPEENDC